ncbi:phospholipase D-like domain-containing protein [Bacillus tianshenii]|nr:phospholipase D-like domain-containing protein [Bacillus tianshenii]
MITSNIVYQGDIKKEIAGYLKNVTHSISIISAYTKISALEYIDSKLGSNVQNKKLMVRFNLNDILMGSTDFEIISYCALNGWELYFNELLHAKIFIYDDALFTIGSANLTSRGLGLCNNANLESIVSGKLSNEDSKKINQMFLCSTLVNEHLVKEMRRQLENIGYSSNEPKIKWNSNIAFMLENSPIYLFSTEMLYSSSPVDVCSHDLLLLGLKRSQLIQQDHVRSVFLSTKVFKWFNSVIEEQIYFGELTAKLHDALIDDPPLYRKDVKLLLSNLLNWLAELEVQNFKVDRPNYSQRIRRV